MSVSYVREILARRLADVDGPEVIVVLSHRLPGLVERFGHYKPAHVKSRPSQLQRALLIGRRQFMAATLQIENTIRGLMRVQGLKLGKVHRNRFSERMRPVRSMR